MWHGNRTEFLYLQDMKGCHASSMAEQETCYRKYKQAGKIGLSGQERSKFLPNIASFKKFANIGVPYNESLRNVKINTEQITSFHCCDELQHRYNMVAGAG